MLFLFLKIRLCKSIILDMFYFLTYILIFFIVSVAFCDCLGITAGLTGLAISVGFASWNYLNCNINECCNNYWIKYDHDGLENSLKRNLFGQHLVEFIVSKSLKAHLEMKDRKKALAMAFHGDTGTGKNYVSKMIAENLYKKGFDSQYVHLYIGTQHFPHKQEVNKYRDKLRKEIEEHTSKCRTSLFIFDEVDKMAPGILDALKPYLDYHEVVDGVDYRNNIFIFLSNAGSRNITEIALKFWHNGKNRNDITLKDIEHLIVRGAFNEEGGLKYSDIVKKELIDVYVPFLPMEKKHVRLCIQSALKTRNLYGDMNFIADQLIYFPPEVELFSTSGCKKISQKVSLYAS